MVIFWIFENFSTFFSWNLHADLIFMKLYKTGIFLTFLVTPRTSFRKLWNFFLKCQKTGGRGGINLPPSSTSLEYLRIERIDRRFHLLISKFVTFWSWRPSQSLHKKQLLRLNKTGKNPCFFKWLFIFNPNRHGGAEFAPPSSFFELYEKVLEVET